MVSQFIFFLLFLSKINMSQLFVHVWKLFNFNVLELTIVVITGWGVYPGLKRGIFGLFEKCNIMVWISLVIFCRMIMLTRLKADGLDGNELYWRILPLPVSSIWWRSLFLKVFNSLFLLLPHLFKETFRAANSREIMMTELIV